jgi:hypothetical protein
MNAKKRKVLPEFEIAALSIQFGRWLALYSQTRNGHMVTTKKVISKLAVDVYLRRNCSELAV